MPENSRKTVTAIEHHLAAKVHRMRDECEERRGDSFIWDRPISLTIGAGNSAWSCRITWNCSEYPAFPSIRERASQTSGFGKPTV
jgi:hypothetical protein